MKKRLAEKIKSNLGESIAEVLVALLISSLALVMLATMIGASSRMTIRSRGMLESYYADNDALEKRAELSSLTGTLSIRNGASDVYLKCGQSALDPIELVYYKNNNSGDTQVVSYKRR